MSSPKVLVAFGMICLSDLAVSVYTICADMFHPGLIAANSLVVYNRGLRTLLPLLPRTKHESFVTWPSLVSRSVNLVTWIICSIYFRNMNIRLV